MALEHLDGGHFTTDVRLKLEGLQGIIQALKANPPIARVGIFGSNVARQGGDPDNATIGAWHEFGTSKVPVRSFLRIPIADKLQKALEDSGAFTKQALENVVAQKSMKSWVEKMAITAVGIVLEGFNTNGYGKWQPLTEATLKRKQSTIGDKSGVPAQSSQILVATGQLRDSITWEVN